MSGARSPPKMPSDEAEGVPVIGFGLRSESRSEMRFYPASSLENLLPRKT